MKAEKVRQPELCVCFRLVIIAQLHRPFPCLFLKGKYGEGSKAAAK
jgi:hypothetical protein